ncbi:MAG: hypothetical protein AAF657_30610 [Acidobacteriota bacterium]
MFCRILRVALPAIVCFASALHADKLSWVLYENPCSQAVAPPAQRIEAGDYGVLYLDAPPMVGCARVAGCIERLRVYPKPVPPPHEQAAECLASVGCYRDFQAVKAPWIYIPDLEDRHGLMVESVVRRSADPAINTLLDPIEPLAPGRCPSPSDADVLVALAHLAEAIDHGGTPAPLAINMSFGRRYESTDARDASCDPLGGTDCAGSLSCQIARLLAHITRPDPEEAPRSLAIAGAGNHAGELLFPAGLGETVSIGMLDLTRFAADGTVLPAKETPTDPDGLMPGNGHCLQLVTSQPVSSTFEIAAPPGASFATALFTGMASTVLWEEGTGFFEHIEAGPLWTPYQACTGGTCPFVLQHNGSTFTSKSLAGGRRLQEIVEGDISQCGTAVGQLTAAAKVVPATEDPFLYDSLIDLIGDTHNPLPEPDPCVPCYLCCEGAIDGAVTKALARRGSQASRQNQIDLTLDLHSGWQFPVELTLEKLYLRVGLEILALNLTPRDLDDIARGAVRTIELHGVVPPTLDWDEQPSLVTRFSWFDPQTLQKRIAWDSTAIVFKD